MRYRRALPQLDGRPFLTDGGLETTLIFLDGLDLPEFAAFPLLADDEGIEALRRYYVPYAELARERGVGFVLESPTWRANPDWAARIGYSEADLDRLNRKAISLVEEIRAEYETPDAPFVISGCIGPQSDGYRPDELLSADAAERYHATQIGTFADTAADLVGAITMTYPQEAIGIVRAASAVGLPAAISFTVETDGRLPNGQELAEAIEQVDGETGAAAAYFMVNCAHPTHFEHVLEPGPWLGRIRGIRANASTMSHAELDEAEELDDGDPDDLAARYVELRTRLPNLNVLGGCCGTDDRHVTAICRAAYA
jgi:S-methylmethionine-dependent homocysteine/selenocysteine methylase